MSSSGESGEERLEILPLVVIAQTFPARPSSIPRIREFVNRCLAESPLSEQDSRAVSRSVSAALLEAAGPAGTIQVSFRILPDHAEVDVLHPAPVPTATPPPGRSTIPVMKFLVMWQIELSLLSRDMAAAVARMPAYGAPLERDGTVLARYHVVGGHGGAWIYDVESHEQLERLLGMAPVYNFARYTVYPLADMAPE